MRSTSLLLLFLVPITLFAQGTIQFANRVSGVVVTHVYETNRFEPLVGNGTNDFPAGTTDWSGFLPATGGSPTNGAIAMLLAAPGSNIPETA